MCSRAAKFNCSYYHSYTEEMCNWGFIILSEKLLRTRVVKLFRKTNKKKKHYKTER